MRRARAFRYGMTLIEVLVVVTILAIAAAAVIPQMGSVGVLRVQGAVRTIVADISFAQSDAIAQQQPRAISFDTTTNSYRVLQVVNNTVDLNNTLYDPTIPGERYEITLNDERFGGALIQNPAFDTTPSSGGGSSSTVLIFDTLGMPVKTPSGNTPSTGGLVEVAGFGTVHQIRIEPFTGRITVRRTVGD
jgi:prepilin-type N-terminal cleavage/methylation domain-containing protein